MPSEEFVSSERFGYYMTLLKLHWPSFTKRDRRRILKVDPLLYSTIKGIYQEALRRGNN